MDTERNFRGRAIVALLVAGTVAMLTIGSAGAVDSTGSDEQPALEAAGQTAVYDGAVIDMSQGWEGACVVWPDAKMTTECFASEAELEARVAEVEGESGAMAATQTSAGFAPPAAAASSCGGYVKLYDGTWYQGSTLWSSTRSSWLNLSNYGFDQRTSSFKIGSCSAYFADLTWGGGSWYPTSLTQAYDVAGTMQSGWDNDVSSVYIL